MWLIFFYSDKTDVFFWIFYIYSLRIKLYLFLNSSSIYNYVLITHYVLIFFVQGISFTDLMYVTKRNMANAVSSMTKHLEQVQSSLAVSTFLVLVTESAPFSPYWKYFLSYFDFTMIAALSFSNTIHLCKMLLLVLCCLKYAKLANTHFDGIKISTCLVN